MMVLIRMRLSKGNYLGFLNSDDKFADGALNTLVKYITNNPSIDFIFDCKALGILHDEPKINELRIVVVRQVLLNFISTKSRFI